MEDYQNKNDDISKGIIDNGQAGSGKTTKLCEMVIEQQDKALVLGFTNRSVENVKNRLCLMDMKRELQIRSALLLIVIFVNGILKI